MITTLFGKNSFELNRRLRALIADFQSKQPDGFGLERFDALESEVVPIIDAITTQPFLTAARLIVIRDANASKDLIAALPAALKRVPETTDVIFVEPTLAKKGEAYKVLSAHTEMKEFPVPDSRSLPAWISDYVKSHSGNITAGAVKQLAEVSPDQQRLASEIDKLLSYQPDIDEALVERLVERETAATIFDMLDHLTSGRVDRAISSARRLRQSQIELPYIVAMLAWQFHLITAVWAAGRLDTGQVAADTGLSPYSLRKAAGLARRLRRSQLKDAFNLLVSLDNRLKSRATDEDSALETTLLRLSTVLS